MIHIVRRLIEVVALVGTGAGVSYYILSLWSAGAYLRYRGEVRSSTASEGDLPPVSILKPLKGLDPEFYECFRSHCLQDYPEYEIIFGVSESGDPAVRTVQRLQQEFPQCSVQLVVCSQKLGANTKVSNLVQMLRAARYDHLIVNDSDIRVESDYLRRVIAPLSEERVGMVTCLYRGIASGTLGSRLEAIGISTDFSAGVVVARCIEGGVRFGLGSTLALRRRDLDAIGGFEAFVDYLADDYELGKSIAALGLEVRLSEVVVETVLPAYDLKGFLEHQLRWARSMRDSRPWGYGGLLFTFGVPWAVLVVIASRGAAWAWGLAAGVASLRLLMAWTVGSEVLRDGQLAALLPLLPLRDFAAVLVWLVSFAGSRIAWRGDYFRLKDGKLARVDP
jgi:ceramide glucosyltransferase